MRLLLLTIVAICLAALAPLFGLSSYVSSILIFGAVNILLCLGFYVIFGLTGILSLAHAAFMAIGAYASAILSSTYGWPILLSIPAGTVVAAATGALLGLPTLRLKSHYLVLVTIAFSEVVRQMAVNLDWLTGGVQGLAVAMPSSISVFRFKFDASNPAAYLLLCLLAIAVLITGLDRFRESRLGWSLEAIRDDELAASVVGINVTHLKVLAFVISAALAGFGGAVYAHFVGFISPDHFTFDTTVLVLAMVVIGGKRSITGVIIGAVLLTALPEVLRNLEDWYPTLYGVLLLLTLWLAPNGIVGRVEKFRLRRRQRASIVKRAGGIQP
jgi:branched-chain amino acid transport system permease protein